MENYKVKVGSEAESEEAQCLFFELGYVRMNGEETPHISPTTVMVRAHKEMGSNFVDSLKTFEFKNIISRQDEYILINIPQLRDMVVLKRNDVADATHVDQYGDKWVCIDSVWYFYTGMKKWDSFAGSDFMSRYDLKPITKEPVMKEYLNKLEDGTYKLVLLDSVADGVKGLIEVPDGAFAMSRGIGFYKMRGDEIMVKHPDAAWGKSAYEKISTISNPLYCVGLHHVVASDVADCVLFNHSARQQYCAL